MDCDFDYKYFKQKFELGKYIKTIMKKVVLKKYIVLKKCIVLKNFFVVV